MHLYRVPVRNEWTGEVRIVEVLSGYGADAQVTALSMLFQQESWRKAIALQPEAEPDDS